MAATPVRMYRNGLLSLQHRPRDIRHRLSSSHPTPFLPSRSTRGDREPDPYRRILDLYQSASLGALIVLVVPRSSERRAAGRKAPRTLPVRPALLLYEFCQSGRWTSSFMARGASPTAATSNRALSPRKSVSLPEIELQIARLLPVEAHCGNQRS